MKAFVSKEKIFKGDAPISKQEKLEQIRSGKKIKRTKSGLERSKVILSKKDLLITAKETKETFEESEVKRRKRNYIMYESKLGTDKNVEITKIQHKSQSKPKKRVPTPRKEEKIVIKKKRRNYLDNYKYHETKVLKNKNPKKKVIVEHKRLGDIIGGFYETKTYQRQVITHGIPQLRNKEYKVSTVKVKRPVLNNTMSEKRMVTSSSTKDQRSRSRSPIQDAINSTTIMINRSRNPRLKPNNSDFGLSKSKSKQKPVVKPKSKSPSISRSNSKNPFKETVKKISVQNTFTRRNEPGKKYNKSFVVVDTYKTIPTAKSNSNITITNLRKKNPVTNKEGSLSKILPKLKVNKGKDNVNADKKPIKTITKMNTDLRKVDHQKVKSDIIINKIMPRKDANQIKRKGSNDSKHKKKSSLRKSSHSSEHGSSSGRGLKKKTSFADLRQPKKNQETFVTRTIQTTETNDKGNKNLNKNLSLDKYTEIKIKIEKTVENVTTQPKKDVKTKTTVIKSTKNINDPSRPSIRNKYKHKK